MTEKTEIKKWATTLDARLKFGIRVDMTEFETQEIKAGDYDKAKRDYLLSKLPADNVIKSIFDNLKESLKSLGYECLILDVEADLDPSANPLLSILKGLTPPRNYKNNSETGK